MQDKDVAAGGETPPVRITDELAELLQRIVIQRVGEGAVLTDWFVAYGAMQRSTDSPTGISYATRYATSDTSPQAAVGIADMGIDSLREDLAGGCSCTCHDE